MSIRNQVMGAAGAASSSGPAGPDTKFNYVTMLLHGDGTNGAQNNTFLDSSPSARTVTRVGTPTQGSFSPYGDNWGNYIPSGSNYLSTSGSAIAFGTGDFTIEWWVYRESEYTSDRNELPMSGVGGTSFMLGMVGGQLQFGVNATSWNVGATNSVALSTWTHLAVVRSSSTVTIYVNGVASGSTSMSTNFTGASAFEIGRRNSGGVTNAANVYCSNMRIVIGTAVYTNNFTPSTLPLTAMSGTSLLTCQSNRFKDSSANAYAVTVNGSPSVQRFNPFGTPTEYSTATNSGSMYFGSPSGATSNLSLTTGLNSMSTWTIECWAYNSASSWADHVILGPWGPNLIRDSNGSLEVYLAGSGKFSSIAWRKNQWNHLALCNDGTSLRLYLNGAQVASSTSTTITLSSMVIGAEQTSSTTNDKWNGYISDFRVLNGTALYTGSTYTVPTAPLTSITNTVLLLKGQNAAIYDNAMMNDLETVGNSQISTSVKKYGTGSLAFDSAGDYLVAGSSSPNLNLSTGDFTIEFWAYRNGITGAAMQLGSGTEDWSPVIGFPSGNNLLIYMSSNGSSWNVSLGQFLGTLAVGSWSHFALTRSGSTFRTFQDGTLVSTFTSSEALYQDSPKLTIGRAQGGASSWNGYIDDLRITKGYARYTANFTPPTAAFSNN